MKTDWRRKKTWDAAGLVLTVAWLVYFAITTGGDLGHPLGNFVFIVPIAIWSVIILIKSRLPD